MKKILILILAILALSTAAMAYNPFTDIQLVENASGPLIAGDSTNFVLEFSYPSSQVAENRRIYSHPVILRIDVNSSLAFSKSKNEFFINGFLETPTENPKDMECIGFISEIENSSFITEFYRSEIENYYMDSIPDNTYYCFYQNEIPVVDPLTSKNSINMTIRTNIALHPGNYSFHSTMMGWPGIPVSYSNGVTNETGDLKLNLENKTIVFEGKNHTKVGLVAYAPLMLKPTFPDERPNPLYYMGLEVNQSENMSIEIPYNFDKIKGFAFSEKNIRIYGFDFENSIWEELETLVNTNHKYVKAKSGSYDLIGVFTSSLRCGDGICDYGESECSLDCGGGSGGRTTSFVRNGDIFVAATSCTSNWECDAWSECVDGRRTRICHDINNCKDSKKETLPCGEASERGTINLSSENTSTTTTTVPGIAEPDTGGDLNGITGAISVFASDPLTGAGIVIAGIIIMFLILRMFGLRKKKK